MASDTAHLQSKQKNEAMKETYEFDLIDHIPCPWMFVEAKLKKLGHEDC